MRAFQFQTTFFTVIAVLHWLPTLSHAVGSDNAAKHPNVIYILADDMGYGDAHCYDQRSLIPTQHLDKLAQQGMRFTDAHSPSAVCSPTRYGILTGRYAWRTVMKSLVLWAFDRPLIEPDRLTVPGMLHRLGYHSACIGKWHLGWSWPTTDGQPLKLPFEIGEPGPHTERVRLAQPIDYTQRLGGGPLAAGFDYYFGDDVINQPPYLWIENDRSVTLPTLPANPNLLYGSSDGPTSADWDQAAVLPELTRRATNYIRQRARHPSEPFFLYFPLTAPHLPIVPPPEYANQSKYGPYGDFVVQVDAIVGQIMAALDETGIAQDTLLIFASDNGSYAKIKDGHHPNGNLRGRKGNIFEGGHRIPLIVRWPDIAPPGSVNHQLVGMQDLMATLAEHLEYPLAAGEAEDSVSLCPTLRDPSIPVRQTLVNHSVSGEFAIRQRDWKLIPSNRQLFDLGQDLAEKENLWEAKPEVVQQLTVLLAQIRGE